MAAPLRLNIERSGRYLRVSWNRNHPLPRQLKQGILSIHEDPQERRLRFDSRDLMSSTVLYEPATGDVTVNLNGRDGRDQYVGESGVARKVMPPVTLFASASIRGTVRVDVKREVDAARQWTFTPGASASHLVRFEFTNEEKRGYLKN
ncbi:MAG: hypothetical protein M3Z23_18810 [Acidobacteriota bacterium]|nr:hypothetical protein [Acidobacteriota bacterium]